MLHKFVCTLCEENAGIGTDDQIYVVPKHSKIEVQVSSGSHFNSQDACLVQRDILQRIYGKRSFFEHLSFDLVLEEPGSYEFWIECGELRGKSNFIIVEPQIYLGRREVKFGSICLQTVLSRCIGNIQRWPEIFSNQKLLGYNMIHLTPIQQPGPTKSMYSIIDHSLLSDEIFPGHSQHSALKLLSETIHYLDTEQGIGCIIDIILNHCSIGSPFIEEHPEAAYNLENCPHQTVAFVMESGLLQFSNNLSQCLVPAYPKNTIETEEDLNKVMNIIENDIIDPLNLYEYFQMKKDRVLSKFTILADQKTEGLKEFILRNAVICEGESPYGVQINTDLVYEHYESINYDQMSRIIDSINSELYSKCRSFIEEAIKNIRNEIHYYKIVLKKHKISGNNPLIRRYFKILQNNSVVICNGYTNETSTALLDLTDGFHYFRRNIVIWGDCIKLRYGSGRSTCPILWDKMEDYVVSMARIFKGFRLDNAHSTPLHVSSHMINAARKVNPNLIIFAEFFSSDQTTDALYIKKLGINLLLRESIHCHDAHDLAYKSYEFGRKKILGSIGHTDIGNSLLGLSNDKILLKPKQVPVLYYDITHDNLTLNQYNRPSDILPFIGAVSMTDCAIATTRGTDELVPERLSVVFERRLHRVNTLDPLAFPPHFVEGFAEAILCFTGHHESNVSVKGSWDDWEDQVQLQQVGKFLGIKLILKEGKTYQYKFINDEDWVLEPSAPTISENGNTNNVIEAKRSSSVYYKDVCYAREIFNRVHFIMAYENFSTTLISYITKDVVMIIRENPESHEAYVLITRPYFNNSDANIEIPPVKLPGIIETVEFAGHLVVGGGYKYDENYITGLDGLLKVSDMSEYCTVVDDTLSFSFIPPSFTMLLRTKMKEDFAILGIYSELKNPNFYENLFKDMKIEDINLLLWKSSQEEKEYTNSLRDVYQFPNISSFKYAGLGSLVFHLSSLIDMNLYSHPIYENVCTGDWLIDYIIDRLKDLPMSFSGYVSNAFRSIKSLPLMVKLQHVSKLVFLLYRLSKIHVIEKIFKIRLDSIKDRFFESLLVSSTQYWGKIKPDSPSRLTESVIENNTVYYETFIVFKVYFLVTEKIQEGKDFILNYAKCIRNGKIPSKIQNGSPVFDKNCDFCYFTEALRLLIEKDGPEILKYRVNPESNLEDVLQSLLEANVYKISARHYPMLKLLNELSSNYSYKYPGINRNYTFHNWQNFAISFENPSDYKDYISMVVAKEIYNEDIAKKVLVVFFDKLRKDIKKARECRLNSRKGKPIWKISYLLKACISFKAVSSKEICKVLKFFEECLFKNEWISLPYYIGKQSDPDYSLPSAISIGSIIDVHIDFLKS